MPQAEQQQNEEPQDVALWGEVKLQQETRQREQGREIKEGGSVWGTNSSPITCFLKLFDIGKLESREIVWEHQRIF